MNSVKAESNTKQFIIPAKYLLQCIADDAATVYPVEVTILALNGGSLFQINTKKELETIFKIRDVYQSSLVRMIKKGGRYLIDIRKEGRMEVQRDFMPERRHMETLVRSETCRFYSLYLQSR